MVRGRIGEDVEISGAGGNIMKGEGASSPSERSLYSEQ